MRSSMRVPMVGDADEKAYPLVAASSLPYRSNERGA